MTKPTPEQLQAAEAWRAWRNYQNKDASVMPVLPWSQSHFELLADYALTCIAAGDETAKLRAHLLDLTKQNGALVEDNARLQREVK